MRTRAAVITAVAVAAVVAAGGVLYGVTRSGETVADCYSATGTTPAGEHLVATLRVTAADGHVTGTYVAGQTAAQGLAYDVAGVLDGDRFAGTFTAAGEAVTATGTMDRDSVVLDDGQGFSVTRFAAGC